MRCVVCARLYGCYVNRKHRKFRGRILQHIYRTVMRNYFCGLAPKYYCICIPLFINIPVTYDIKPHSYPVGGACGAVRLVDPTKLPGLYTRDTFIRAPYKRTLARTSASSYSGHTQFLRVAGGFVYDRSFHMVGSSREHERKYSSIYTDQRSDISCT